MHRSAVDLLGGPLNVEPTTTKQSDEQTMTKKLPNNLLVDRIPSKQRRLGNFGSGDAMVVVD